MAAVAIQVHSRAQQIGARIGWNPINAATHATGTRERVLNLSDPRTDHRNLGFEGNGSASLRLGRCAKELRLLRDCSTVGAWIGRTEVQAGIAVVKDCLAAPHQ